MQGSSQTAPTSKGAICSLRGTLHATTSTGAVSSTHAKMCMPARHIDRTPQHRRGCTLQSAAAQGEAPQAQGEAQAVRLSRR